EVRAVRAGDVWPDRAAFAKERMARAAHLVEDRAPARGIGPSPARALHERTVPLDLGCTVAAVGTCDAPDAFERRREPRMAEQAHLPGNFRRHVARGN